MNELEITFDTAPWEGFVDGLQPGTRVDGAALMTLLEGEECLDEVFQALEDLAVKLDLTGLPKPAGTGEAALRLRREEQWVASGMDRKILEQSDPLALYLEELELLPTADQSALLDRCRSGDEMARATLMNACLPQVVRAAARYVGRGVLLMDLIQEGNLGLWQAIAQYDGGNFEALRDRCVDFALAKTVIIQAQNNGVGQKMRQAVEDYREVDERLLSDLGRNPTLEEMAEELHITLEEAEVVSKMLENVRQMSKVHTPQEREEAEASQEDEQAVEDTAYFQMRQRIADLLADLPEQDAQILTARFGLDGGLPLSPEDTGRKLGLTPEEVLAREATALTKLRTLQG